LKGQQLTYVEPPETLLKTWGHIKKNRGISRRRTTKKNSGGIKNIFINRNIKDKAKRQKEEAVKKKFFRLTLGVSGWGVLYLGVLRVQTMRVERLLFGRPREVFITIKFGYFLIAL